VPRQVALQHLRAARGACRSSARPGGGCGAELRGWRCPAGDPRSVAAVSSVRKPTIRKTRGGAVELELRASLYSASKPLLVTKENSASGSPT